MMRTAAGLALLLVMALIAVAVVMTPTMMTQPMRYHTPELLERLYALRSWGTAISLALLLGGAVVFARLWKRSVSWWAPALATVPLLVLTGAVFFSRQHPVEWMMFAPPETVAFEDAAAATHVAQDDYVMGVVLGGQARAYPVRMVAYYHIVNDDIGDEPFVVTY